MFFPQKIEKGKVVLIVKNGDVKRVLTEGSYRLGFNEKAYIYDLSVPFTTKLFNMNALLQNEAFRAAVEVVEVADNEIVLRYDNNNFAMVLRPGRYVYWKGLVEYKFLHVDLNEKEISAEIAPQVLMMPQLRQYLQIFIVANYEQGLLLERGKLVRVLEGGFHYFWKTPEPLQLLKADTRQLQIEINGQEILTKDKAAVRANYVLQYRIADAEKAVVETNDYVKQLYVLTQLALREYLGGYTLDEILEKKTEAADEVKNTVAERAPDYGLTVIDGGIKDIILPGEMREIMNRVLIAQKQAEANTITRREETASVRSLLNTAKLLEENEMLFRLKEMEYVEKIADKINGITVGGDRKVLDGLRDIFSVSGKN